MFIKKYFLFFQLIIGLLISTTAFSADYTWSSFLGSTNWNSNLNWTGGPTFPGPGDNVTITGLVVNSPVVPAGGVTINNFTLNNGAILGQGLNCNGQTLTITGIAQFNGATVTAGNIICTGTSADFNGTTFNSTVTATCNTILLNGSVFNNTTTLTKTGTTNDNGNGGNEFNGSLTINNSGSGILRTGITVLDEYNNIVSITNSSSGQIILSDNTGTTEFDNTVSITNSGSGAIYFGNGASADIEFQNSVDVLNSSTGDVRFADFALSNISILEDITVNSTANGNIYFGENGGTTSLADTKTISIGGTGFSAGTLHLKNFNQIGTTAQNLVLTGSANISFLNNTIFNGNLNTSTVSGTLTVLSATFNREVTASCGRIFLNTGVFNDITTLTKIGSGTDDSFGNNTFNDQVLFRNTGSGDFNLASSAFDIINDTVIGINGSSGSLSLATGNATHTFNGVSLVNNGSGTIYFSKLAGATTIVNGNFNSKLTNSGFIDITSNAASTTTFIENITFESNSSGTIITGNSNGTTNLATGKTVTIGSFGYSNGFLTLNRFVQNGSLTQNLTLSNTASLTIGPNSIFNGRLNATTATGTVTLNTASFIDSVIVSSGGFFVNSNTFSQYTQLISNGTGTYTSLGGNIFNDLTEIINNSSGTIQLASTNLDTFNDSIYVNNTSSGNLILAHNAATSFNDVYALNTNSGELILGNLSNSIASHNGELYLENSANGQISLHKENGSVSTFSENIAVTNTGTGTIQFGINGGTGTLANSKIISPSTSGITNGLLSLYNFTQIGVTPHDISPTGTGSLTIGTGSVFNASVNFNVAGVLTLLNATFNNTFNSSSSDLYTSGTTYNGVTTMIKTGAGSNHSIGGNIFNDSLDVNMNGAGTLRFANITGDDYNGYTEYHWTTGQLEPCYSGINTFNSNVWIDGALTMDIPSTMRLDGNNQTITMTGVDSAYIETLDLSTATGTVTTVGHIILPNATSTVSLGAAILDLNGYELRVHNSINTSITRTSGYILSEQTNNSSKVSWDIGTSTDLFTIPFGNNNGKYIPFHINVTAGDIGTFSISTYGTGSNNLPMPITPDTVKHIFAYFGTQYDNSTSMIDRYWQLDKTGNATSTIRFTYDEDELQIPNIIVESNLRAQRWNSTIEDWDDGVGTPNIVANMVVVTNVSEFSPWVLVDNNSPLPVTWLDFNISKDHNDKAKLDWSTATETNNDYFTIEQSKVIETPTIVDFVDGSGTTNSVKQYSYTDQNTIEGLSYYRVKQTDYDGNSTYTDWKSINIDNNSKALVHMDNNNLVIKTTNNQKGIVTVYSTDGKVLGSGQITETKTTIPVSIEASSILVYSIEFNDGNIQNGKVLKN